MPEHNIASLHSIHSFSNFCRFNMNFDFDDLFSFVHSFCVERYVIFSSFFYVKSPYLFMLCQRGDLTSIINEKGCLMAGEEWLGDHVIVVAGVAVGIAFLQVCVIYTLPKNDTTRYYKDYYETSYLWDGFLGVQNAAMTLTSWDHII